MLYDKPLNLFEEFSSSENVNEYFKQYLLDLNVSQLLTIPLTAIKDDVRSQLNWWDTVTRLSYIDEMQNMKEYKKEEHSEMQDIFEIIINDLNNKIG